MYIKRKNKTSLKNKLSILIQILLQNMFYISTNKEFCFALYRGHWQQMVGHLGANKQTKPWKTKEDISLIKLKTAIRM